jgi:hypothetical protein
MRQFHAQAWADEDATALREALTRGAREVFELIARTASDTMPTKQLRENRKILLPNRSRIPSLAVRSELEHRADGRVMVEAADEYWIVSPLQIREKRKVW